MTQFLYWQSPENGKLKATVVCGDGHVHLAEIPPDDTARYDDIVREFANSCERLPFSVEQASEHFDGIGMPRLDINPGMLFFGPLPVEAPKEAAQTQTEKTDENGVLKLRFSNKEVQ